MIGRPSRRGPRRQLIRESDGTLYDLTNDPWELQNLDGDPAYAAQELQLAAELAVLKGSPSAPQGQPPLAGMAP